MVPYPEAKLPKARPLGLLRGKATVSFSHEFQISDEQFHSS
jgi:hypothetical protein